MYVYVTYDLARAFASYKQLQDVNLQTVLNKWPYRIAVYVSIFIRNKIKIKTHISKLW